MRRKPTQEEMISTALHVLTCYNLHVGARVSRWKDTDEDGRRIQVIVIREMGDGADIIDKFQELLDGLKQTDDQFAEEGVGQL